MGRHCRPVHRPDLIGQAPATSNGSHALVRRRIAVGVTLAVGTTLLAGTLRATPGSRSFFLFGLGAAASWIVGAAVSGPLPLHPLRPTAHHGVPPALVLALLTFLGFWAADAVGHHLPYVSTALHNVLTRADKGPVVVVLAVTLVNGLGEELFFRGALFAAVGTRRPVLSSTIIYVAVTVATGNIALVAAAAVMGTLFARQRAHTGSILASTVTHLGWATLMLLALPR
jgi:membrane protease YdiL (CAAX protease family)